MTHPFCGQEKEIRRLIDAGAWPQAAPPDLRSHADRCDSCAELILVRQAFRSARTTAIRQASLQSPGLLWWRAQLRRRNAAVERIGRPLLGAQLFALCITAMLIAGFIVSQAKEGVHWIASLKDLPSANTKYLASLWNLSMSLPTIPGTEISLLVPALLMLALLSAVIVFLVLDDSK